jgi:hypothetical protein
MTPTGSLVAAAFRKFIAGNEFIDVDDVDWSKPVTYNIGAEDIWYEFTSTNTEIGPRGRRMRCYVGGPS